MSDELPLPCVPDEIREKLIRFINKNAMKKGTFNDKSSSWIYLRKIVERDLPPCKPGEITAKLPMKVKEAIQQEVRTERQEAETAKARKIPSCTQDAANQFKALYMSLSNDYFAGNKSEREAVAEFLKELSDYSGKESIRTRLQRGAESDKHAVGLSFDIPSELLPSFKEVAEKNGWRLNGNKLTILFTGVDIEGETFYCTDKEEAESAVPAVTPRQPAVSKERTIEPEEYGEEEFEAAEVAPRPTPRPKKAAKRITTGIQEERIGGAAQAAEEAEAEEPEAAGYGEFEIEDIAAKPRKTTPSKPRAKAIVKAMAIEEETIGEEETEEEEEGESVEKTVGGIIEEDITGRRVKTQAVRPVAQRRPKGQKELMEVPRYKWMADARMHTGRGVDKRIKDLVNSGVIPRELLEPFLMVASDNTRGSDYITVDALEQALQELADYQDGETNDISLAINRARELNRKRAQLRARVEEEQIVKGIKPSVSLIRQPVLRGRERELPRSKEAEDVLKNMAQVIEDTRLEKVLVMADHVARETDNAFVTPLDVKEAFKRVFNKEWSVQSLAEEATIKQDAKKAKKKQESIKFWQHPVGSLKTYEGNRVMADQYDYINNNIMRAITVRVKGKPLTLMEPVGTFTGGCKYPRIKSGVSISDTILDSLMQKCREGTGGVQEEVISTSLIQPSKIQAPIAKAVAPRTPAPPVKPSKKSALEEEVIEGIDDFDGEGRFGESDEITVDDEVVGEAEEEPSSGNMLDDVSRVLAKQQKERQQEKEAIERKRLAEERERKYETAMTMIQGRHDMDKKMTQEELDVITEGLNQQQKTSVKMRAIQKHVLLSNK